MEQEVQPPGVRISREQGKGCFEGELVKEHLMVVEDYSTNIAYRVL